MVIFDRSWYNRAGVEPVMGFCTQAETDRFLALLPGTEKAMTDSGIVLLKYWLEVSADEQTRRGAASTTLPKVFPDASPRRLVQIGFLALFAGTRLA